MKKQTKKKNRCEKLAFSNVYCIVEKWNGLKKPILTQLLMDSNEGSTIEIAIPIYYLTSQNECGWILQLLVLAASTLFLAAANTFSHTNYFARKYSKQFIVENELVY